jgi:hypothetical protein
MPPWLGPRPAHQHPNSPLLQHPGRTCSPVHSRHSLAAQTGGTHTSALRTCQLTVLPRYQLGSGPKCNFRPSFSACWQTLSCPSLQHLLDKKVWNSVLFKERKKTRSCQDKKGKRRLAKKSSTASILTKESDPEAAFQNISKKCDCFHCLEIGLGTRYKHGEGLTPQKVSYAYSCWSRNHQLHTHSNRLLALSNSHCNQNNVGTSGRQKRH